MTELTFDPGALELPSGHFIDGEVRQTAGSSVDVACPSDGRRLGEVPDADENLVDLAVTNARLAFERSGWASCPPRERGRVLRRWADLIDGDAVRLAQLEAVCSTRPVTHAYADDVPFTAEAIRFFGELADKLGGDVAATSRESLGFVASEPYGVVGAIAPWNFPISMCSWKCGPALAAGNAVVLKPSELTPFSILRLAQLAIQAGMPPGIFNIINGRGSGAGEALVRHPDIGKISFTGSTRSGSAIMSAIARFGIKPITLELGGKSPQLVFAEVPDLEQTAECIVRGFTSNAGQACVAGTRLIAHRRIVEPLLDAILSKLSKFDAIPTWDSLCEYAPIIGEPQAERIQKLINQSVAFGAEVVAGGHRIAQGPGGAFYRPTVLCSVTNDMPAVREEIFGPVLTVQVFDEEQEGIAMADHPTYGLAAGIHTRDLGQAMRAMRRISAGTIWINRYGRSRDFIIPTGGFRQSGIGKDLGVQAMEGSMRHKSVLVDFALQDS
jgi:aldehyde dehydrogenase (NAD+)